MILFGEDALRTSIRQFVDHYHLERNRQGLENRLIILGNPAGPHTHSPAGSLPRDSNKFTFPELFVGQHPRVSSIWIRSKGGSLGLP